MKLSVAMTVCEIGGMGGQMRHESTEIKAQMDGKEEEGEAFWTLVSMFDVWSTSRSVEGGDGFCVLVKDS